MPETSGPHKPNDTDQPNDELRAQFREVDREDAPMLLCMLAEYELEAAGQLKPGESIDGFVVNENGAVILRIQEEHR